MAGFDANLGIKIWKLYEQGVKLRWKESLLIS